MIGGVLGWEIWDETIRMTGYRNNINIFLLYINLYPSCLFQKVSASLLLDVKSGINNCRF